CKYARRLILVCLTTGPSRLSTLGIMRSFFKPREVSGQTRSAVSLGIWQLDTFLTVYAQLIGFLPICMSSLWLLFSMGTARFQWTREDTPLLRAAFLNPRRSPTCLV